MMDRNKLSYLLVFDVRRNRTRLRIWRRLRKLGAKRLQQSVWEYPDAEPLLDLVKTINSAGERAVVLEKQVVYKTYNRSR